LKFLVPILFLLFFGMNTSAQPWMAEPYMKIRKANDTLKLTDFYEIQRAFGRYEKAQLRKRDKEEKVNTEDSTIEEDEGQFPGDAQFHRWENHMAPRVYPSGNITLASTAYQEFEKYLATTHQSERSLLTANWTALGPTGTITNGDWGGAGRVNFLRFDPVNPSNMWVVSPLGGLWKSTNGGQTWTTNTDFLPVIGCSDVAINPINTQIMYLATGDANGTGSQLSTSSIGILKSTNGGATWPTSSNTLNWDVSWNRAIYKLLIHPTHPDTVFAATNVGIFRTVNGGTNWVTVKVGIFTDIEFKPGHPNVIYATSGIFSDGTFYKSTDNGNTFNPISDGLPLPADVARMEIGVTPADSNYVYIAVVKKNTYDFYGFYRSVNGGDQFTLQANTPNILFGQAGSQAWYNLCVSVSPLHRDTILVGATNIWRSLDGGLTWTKHTSELGGFIPFVHPDHHSITFYPGTDSIYYSGNDGGLFKTVNRGVSWTTSNEGLQISQMYRIGVSPLDPYTILTGHQDMATQILHNSTWNIFTINTGDGMENIYEHDNDSIRYLESYFGNIRVTYNNYPLYKIVCTATGSGVNSQGSWLTPYVMHPQHDSTLLVGKAQVYRTLDGGQTFSQVGNVTGGTAKLIALAYAESDPNYIYAAKTNKFFVAEDGNNFVDRTGILPVGSASITAIAVCNTNPKKVWVSFSGYSAGNKVWYSPDAGLSWSNYSTGLPNLPVNCITYQHASNDGLYVGTDVGIYYIDHSFTAWQSFFTGLPNVDVEELEVAYTIGKIRAATNGRGLWESDVAVPVPASFTWIGGVSSDWNNPDNWNPHGVPTPLQNVIIPDVISPNHDPVVNVTGLGCKDLTLQPGANMTVPAGNVFTTKHQ